MQQIIAMGGGGFSMEPENPLLDLYILKQIDKPRPKICFFAHATDDAVRYSFNFFKVFTQFDCQPSTLSMFQTPPMSHSSMESFILEQDAIYVGGGNTKSMLALWQAWGLDEILREAYQKGILLAGIGAGANCWFEQCVTDSATPELSALPCLGIVKGSCCPHYDGEPLRRPTYLRLIKTGQIVDGIALDDGAAAHFIDGELIRVVSSRPNARAYKLRRAGDAAGEQSLETRYLGT